MSDIQISLAALGILLMLLFLRVPIAVALGLVSFFGIWIVMGRFSSTP